ncbi:MAG: hypothetical protein WAK90_18955, partial [Pseudolabrys sp.]
MPRALPSQRLHGELQQSCQVEKYSFINRLNRTGECLRGQKHPLRLANQAKVSARPGARKYLLTIPTYL